MKKRVKNLILALSFILFSSLSPAVENNLPSNWQKTNVEQNLNYEGKSYTATRVYNKREKKNTWLIIEKENNTFIGDSFDELFLYSALAEFATIKDYVNFHTGEEGGNKLIAHSLENKLDEIIKTSQNTIYAAELLENGVPQQAIEESVEKLKSLINGLVIIQPSSTNLPQAANYSLIEIFKSNKEKEDKKENIKEARELALDKIKTATFDLKKTRLLLETKDKWDYQTAHIFYELYKNALIDLASYSELYQNLQPALGWRGVLQSTLDGLLEEKAPVLTPLSLENALKSSEAVRSSFEKNLTLKINPPPNQQQNANIPSFVYPFSTPIETGFFVDTSVIGAGFELGNKKFLKYVNYGFNEEFCTIEASRSPEADGIQITSKIVFNNRDAEFFLYPICYKNEEGKTTTIELYLLHDFQFGLKANFTFDIKPFNDYTKLITIGHYTLSSARNSRNALQLLVATEESDVTLSISLY